MLVILMLDRAQQLARAGVNQRDDAPSVADSKQIVGQGCETIASPVLLAADPVLDLAGRHIDDGDVVTSVRDAGHAIRIQQRNETGLNADGALQLALETC